MDLNPETYRPYQMYSPSSRSFSFRWLTSGWLLYIVFFAAAITVEQGIAHNISKDGAVHAAEAMGYSDVKITDRHTFFPNFRGCGKDDMVKFDVTATDPKGVERKFFVCDGLFKGATVRFN